MLGQPGGFYAPPPKATGELPANEPLTGKVKAWMEDKGFGFVTPDMGGPDVFVHKNQLSDCQVLSQGAPVTFQCRLNPARGKYEATTCSGGPGGLQGPSPEELAMASMGVTPGAGAQDNLFIAGLPMDITEDRVREMFGKYGSVVQCKVLPPQPGKADGATLVRFGDEQQAKWIVENMNGAMPEGCVQPISVRYAGSGRQDQGKGYGKMGGMPMQDNRFSPYGAPGGMAGPGPCGAYRAPVMDSSTGTAGLNAALSQLLPGLSQNPQLAQTLQQLSQNPSLAQSLQALQGMPGMPGMAQNPALAGMQGLQPGMPGMPGLQPGPQGYQSSPHGLPGMQGMGSASPQSQMAGTASPQGPTDGFYGCGAPQNPMGGAAYTTPAAATEPSNGSSQQYGAAPGLPGGAASGGYWLEATDQATGRPYYYHSVTRDVRWDRPPEGVGGGP
mmetsp:Transcript_41171/g.89945  ORF Transcript_41171/g.89945 Transcript_41171/m.89945 type:complete len:443 (+) Transcript_41171:168-1496(+)